VAVWSIERYDADTIDDFSLEVGRGHASSLVGASLLSRTLRQFI
jgi:hypothetical protein